MMVLDTHIWVNWIVRGDKSLSRAILEAMDSQSSLAVSAISCFEVSLLVKLGKLELPLPTHKWLGEALEGSGVTCLPISCRIAQRSVALSNIHKDPADRIIMATALVHEALLASVDSVFPSYPEMAGCLIGYKN